MSSINSVPDELIISICELINITTIISFSKINKKNYFLFKKLKYLICENFDENSTMFCSVDYHGKYSGPQYIISYDNIPSGYREMIYTTVIKRSYFWKPFNYDFNFVVDNKIFAIKNSREWSVCQNALNDMYNNLDRNIYDFMTSDKIKIVLVRKKFQKLKINNKIITMEEEIIKPKSFKYALIGVI
jgi:hypothetical protein